MSEFFASIKAFIEKGNIIVFLLAFAAGIFTYQAIIRDILWSIFAFCIAYAVFTGISTLFSNYIARKKKKEERNRSLEAGMIQKQNEDAQAQKERELKEAHLRTIYASLPEDVKEGLELLYRLPQPEGGFVNTRILTIEQTNEFQKIINATHQIIFNLNLEDLIGIQHSIHSEIITIIPDFYLIIEEKAKLKGE